MIAVRFRDCRGPEFTTNFEVSQNSANNVDIAWKHSRIPRFTNFFD
jgi:hypothetical protein